MTCAARSPTRSSTGSACSLARGPRDPGSLPLEGRGDLRPGPRRQAARGGARGARHGPSCSTASWARSRQRRSRQRPRREAPQAPGDSSEGPSRGRRHPAIPGRLARRNAQAGGQAVPSVRRRRRLPSGAWRTDGRVLRPPQRSLQPSARRQAHRARRRYPRSTPAYALIEPRAWPLLRGAIAEVEGGAEAPRRGAPSKDRAGLDRVLRDAGLRKKDRRLVLVLIGRK